MPLVSADQTECGMDMSMSMSMSATPVDGTAQSHAGHGMMPDSGQSEAAGCCAADASTRPDCLAMVDCHRCSGSFSVPTFPLADDHLTAIPVSSTSVATIPLLPPASPPSDRWRPPINA